MTYEELEALTNEIREKIGEESSALISESLLNILSSYNNLLNEVENIKLENLTLKADKEELLKTNGKLFQKIGFDKEVEETAETEEDDETKSIDEIIENLIDEKGEII